MPHEVTGKFFKVQINEVRHKLVIQNCKCSCKVGEFKSCKHSVALLLFLNRHWWVTLVSHRDSNFQKVNIF